MTETKYYLLVDYGTDGWRLNEFNTIEELNNGVRNQTHGSPWKAIEGKELSIK